MGPYEAVAVRADGDVVPVRCVVTATTLDGHPVRAAGLRDLRPVQRLEADRRALEQRLQRAQRLDSLGVLAGGIAHDFNNLLAGVLGNADLLREMVVGREEREIAESIVVAAQRAAALTRQMLAYAGQRDLGRREPVDIGELVGELRTLLGATLSKKAQLELAVDARSVVLGDRATLTQVLMNLLTNASDALGDGAGIIRVVARRVTQPDGRWDSALGATVKPGNGCRSKSASTEAAAWTKPRAGESSSRSSRPRSAAMAWAWRPVWGSCRLTAARCWSRASSGAAAASRCCCLRAATCRRRASFRRPRARAGRAR